MEYQDKITSLENENSLLKQQLNEIKEHLKKYTAPTRAKKYYENNKKQIMEYKKNNKPTSEKIQEYNKTAYEKRKQTNNITKQYKENIS